MNKIVIFTDGASRGNPGPGGWGAVIAYRNQLIAYSKKESVIELGGRETNTTNNRMELIAAIKALEYISYKLKPISYKLDIYTDSSYLINGITKWVSAWRMNDWRTKAKKEVLNRELWEELVEQTENKNIEWKYSGGHSGIAGNERCDEIATEFADGKEVNLHNSALSKYPIDILNFNFNEAKTQKKAALRRHSGLAAYSYVSMVDGKIKTHKSWPDCEKRVKGKSGARFKKATSAAQEKEIISAWE